MVVSMHLFRVSKQRTFGGVLRHNMQILYLQPFMIRMIFAYGGFGAVAFEDLHGLCATVNTCIFHRCWNDV